MTATQRRVTPGAIMVMTAQAIKDDRAAWLAARRYNEVAGTYCIGSSDVPAILGIEGSGNPVEVWHEKVTGIEKPDNPAMMWGRLDEDTTARYWRDRNRSAVQAIGLIANVEAPWHQTTLDRLVLECPLDRNLRRRCALEIKHRGAFGSRRWHAVVPDDVLAQICHQLYTSQLDHIHYAVRIGGNEYRQGVIRADEDAQTIAYVIKAVNAWKRAHLAARGQEVEPRWPIETKASALIELDGLRHDDRTELITVSDTSLVRALAEARAESAAAAKAEKAAKAAVLQQADGARFVSTQTDNGTELLYEFTPASRSNVDLDVLREKYPAAYADPEVVKQSTSWTLKINKSLVSKLPPPGGGTSGGV